jgi:hypothetical protein
MITPFRLQYAFAVLLLCVSCFAGMNLLPPPNNWSVVSSPFRPVNIAAQGATIWVCGVDEMILSSSDGGATWETKHQNLNGEVLLDISFVNEKIGHAAGTGGLLLSTDDVPASCCCPCARCFWSVDVSMPASPSFCAAREVGAKPSTLYPSPGSLAAGWTASVCLRKLAVTRSRELS